MFLLVEQLQLARRYQKRGGDSSPRMTTVASPGVTFASDSASAVGMTSSLPDAAALSFPLSRPSVFQLDDTFWPTLWAAATRTTYRKGDVVVINPTSDKHHLYHVVQGAFDLKQDGKSLGRVSEGDLFGEVNMLLDLPLPFVITATVDSVLVALGGAVLRAILSIHWELETKFFFWLATKLSLRIHSYQGKARQAMREQHSPKNSFLERLTQMARKSSPATSGSSLVADDVSVPALRASLGSLPEIRGSDKIILPTDKK